MGGIFTRKEVNILSSFVGDSLKESSSFCSLMTVYKRAYKYVISKSFGPYSILLLSRMALLLIFGAISPHQVNLRYLISPPPGYAISIHIRQSIQYSTLSITLYVRPFSIVMRGDDSVFSTTCIFIYSYPVSYSTATFPKHKIHV